LNSIGIKQHSFFGGGGGGVIVTGICIIVQNNVSQPLYKYK
jgi:hypothetical protein